MNWKKPLSLALSGALALSLLAGCGAAPAPSTSPSPAPAAPSATPTASAAPAAAPIQTAYDDTQTADVVVIGAGGSGLAAALTAVENGAESVIILERTARTGGSLNYTNGSMSAAETTIQKEDGIEDSKELFVQDIIRNGTKFGGKVDEAMIRAFVEEDTAAFEWLYANGLSDNKCNTDKEGRRAVFAPEHDLYSVQRTYKYKPEDAENYKSAAHEILDGMVKAEPKIQVVFNTMAVELAANDQGQVLTVVGVHDGGAGTRYDAARGVIVATGGYSGNQAMMAQYAEYGGSYLVGGPSTADGNGLLMMQKVGGALNEDSMSAIPIFPMGLVSKSDPTTGTIASTYTWKAGGITVNKNGERFENEQDPNNAAREEALTLQPDAIQYDIFTDKIVEDLRAAGGSMMYDLMFGGEDSMGRHVVVEAGSLEELAEKAGLPADKLKATVEAYNAQVDAGGTDEFGRTYDDQMNTFKLAVNKIEGDRFYAIPLRALCVMTLGGITTNTDMQVLDQSGTPIPGLFASGEVVGGVWGKFVSGGTGVMGAITFGRLAGRSAMTTPLASGYTVAPASNLLKASLFETRNAAASAPSFDMSTPLKDGAYEATVDGQEGELTVSVTIAGGRLAAVDVVDSHETPSIGGKALETLPDEMVAGNSPDVEAVSGATLTTNRLRDAVVKCLEQAAA